MQFLLGARMRSMVEPQSRYEYRVWDDTLEAMRDRLERLASTSPAEVGPQTYLISAKTDKCNLKIRDGRINMKELLGTEDRLELWKPVLDGKFPLDRSIIAERIFPGLELRTPQLPRPQYAIDEFLTEVIQSEREIAIVTMVKKRTRYQLDQSLAEFTSVAIGKIECDTVAVESINPEPVLRLIRQLQIDRLPNTNYVRQLKQILGIIRTS
jgi:hypothetical protein